jgi:hypothetical protein
LKNKIFGIFLIVCLVAPVVTTYLVFKYQKKQIKREIKRKIISEIDKSELVLLKFTEEEKNTQLKWEHSNEFEYKGEMYDIVESSTVGDTTYYWLWWDHKESKLNKQLNNILKTILGKNPQNNRNKELLINFLKSLYHNIESKLIKPHLILNVQHNKLRSENFKNIFSKAPILPPPEII